MSILRNSTDIKTRLMVYYAHFYSVIQYGIEMWGSAAYSNNIFKVQKKIIRIMTFSKLKSSCRPLFKNLGLMSLPSLYIYKCILFVMENIQFNKDKHQYNTRHKGDFTHNKHNLSIFQKSPSYMGGKFFNLLPNHLKLKSAESSVSFKKCLRDYLVERAFYSVKEFINP